MRQTLITAILISCLLGVLVGLGTAYGLLTVNGWQAEYETKSYEMLTETVRAITLNPNAKAQIDITTHHFGIMEVKGVGEHDFFIANVGTEDLILYADRTSCSCLGIHITPTRIPPGRTARCRLEYTSEFATTGTFTQGGVVLTNDPDNREIHLSVVGVFTDPIVVSPSTVNFSRIRAGAGHTATIQFYGFEKDMLEFHSPTWEDNEHFDFQWKDAQPPNIADEESHLRHASSVIEGTVTLKPGLPVGSFQEWFQIQTNYPRHRIVRFVATGQIEGTNVTVRGQGYSDQRGVAEWGTIDRGRRFSRDFSIQFRGVAALASTVRVSAVSPDWLQTHLSEPTDAGGRRTFSLTVIIPEDAPSGNFSFSGDGLQANITLETNDETMPVVRIPLQFTVR